MGLTVNSATNLATLAGWPVWLLLLDIGWGAALTLAMAAAARWAGQRFNGR